jgi:hypothetical protein
MWCLHKSLCPSRCLSHREGVFGYLTPRNPGWEKNKTVAPLSETRGCSSIYKYQNCFSLHPMHPFYSQPINWHLPLAPPNHNRAVQYNWPVGLQRIENQACQSPGSTHHGTTCDCCHHLSVEILLHLREVLGTGTYELGATAACLFVCLFVFQMLLLLSNPLLLHILNTLRPDCDTWDGPAFSRLLFHQIDLTRWRRI